MVKMKLRAALAVLGTMVPFLVQADDSNAGQNQPASMFNQGNSVKENKMQGERDSKNQLPAAYNQAACWECSEPFDIYLSGSFLYWTAQQEAMGIGVFENTAGSEVTSIFQTGGYKPAFKVGFGFDMKGMDHWNFASEYTWYNSTNTTTFSTSPAAGSIYFYIEGDEVNTATFASSVSSKWKLDVNILDAAFQRPFYSGRKLTMNVGCGLRALYLTQHQTLNYSDAFYFDGTVDHSLGTESHVYKSKMWGLGPRVEIDGNWLFGAGFRFTGRFANSLLFASYTTLTRQGSDTAGYFTPDTTSPNGNYNTVRAVTEAGLGLGWGSYCWGNSFHFDLYAGYDFNAFWNQNVLNQAALAYAAAGSLYLHGLTVTARFDF